VRDGSACAVRALAGSTLTRRQQMRLIDILVVVAIAAVTLPIGGCWLLFC
jgi:hypothetical protein